VTSTTIAIWAARKRSAMNRRPAVDRDTLRRAIVRLPEAHRRVILLKYFDGLEVDELCAAIGCSRETFAVKLHRALRSLRAAIGQEATDAA
jgi:RNA polymerase sigma-70 factor (ECF subfamily)